jgi:cell division protein FtsL
MSARLLFILLIALIFSALGVVTTQHKTRKLYVELQKAEEMTKRLEVEWGQLQLEQGPWSTHRRVERIATRELNMRLPGPGRLEIINSNATLRAPAIGESSATH